MINDIDLSHFQTIRRQTYSEYKTIPSRGLTTPVHSTSQNPDQSSSSDMDHTKESKPPHLLQR